MEVFQDYAYYYNTFYQDKDYKKEADDVIYLLEKYGNGIKDIIDFGCGTGKHDVELCKKGLKCTGVDISALMVDIAKKNVEYDVETKDISFFVADIREYEPEKKYDAVLSLFHVMSYQNSNDDFMSALHTARKCLKKGGILLFDAWYGPGVLTDKPSVRVKEIEDSQNILLRIAEPSMDDRRNIVDVHYKVLITNKFTNKVKVINETHSMRYYFLPEVKLFFEMTGFEFLDSIDCKILQTTSYDTWTNYYVARAI